jgi:hypothetical protein
MKVNWKVKLGLNMLIVGYLLVVILFFTAFFNPKHMVIIKINNFYERWVELGIVLISFYFVFRFLKELSNKQIIRWFK